MRDPKEIEREIASLEARIAYLRRQLAARRYYNAQPINPINPILWQPRVPATALPTTAFVVYGD